MVEIKIDTKNLNLNWTFQWW